MSKTVRWAIQQYDQHYYISLLGVFCGISGLWWHHMALPVIAIAICGPALMVFVATTVRVSRRWVYPEEGK